MERSCCKANGKTSHGKELLQVTSLIVKIVKVMSMVLNIVQVISIGIVKQLMTALQGIVNQPHAATTATTATTATIATTGVGFLLHFLGQVK